MYVRVRLFLSNRKEINAVQYRLNRAQEAQQENVKKYVENGSICTIGYLALSNDFINKVQCCFQLSIFD